VQLQGRRLRVCRSQAAFMRQEQENPG